MNAVVGPDLSDLVLPALLHQVPSSHSNYRVHSAARPQSPTIPARYQLRPLQTGSERTLTLIRTIVRKHDNGILIGTIWACNPCL
jgi:hypothetical protein